jgi:hypothetical protein
VYRRILEELYGATVSEMALVILHPNNDSYQVVMLNRMDDEVTAMIEWRRAKLLGLPAPASPAPAPKSPVATPKSKKTASPLFVDE